MDSFSKGPLTVARQSNSKCCFTHDRPYFPSASFSKIAVGWCIIFLKWCLTHVDPLQTHYDWLSCSDRFSLCRGTIFPFSRYQCLGPSPGVSGLIALVWNPGTNFPKLPRWSQYAARVKKDYSEVLHQVTPNWRPWAKSSPHIDLLGLQRVSEKFEMTRNI